MTVDDDFRAVVVKTRESTIDGTNTYSRRVGTIRRIIEPTVDTKKYTLSHLHNLKSYDVIFLIHPHNQPIPNHTNLIHFNGGKMRRVPCEELSLHIRKTGYICVDDQGRMWRIEMNPARS